MTVIAWDGRTLAVDRQSTHAGLRRGVQKYRKLKGGGIVAWCGALTAGLIMAEWYEAGADLSKYPKCQDSDDNAEIVVIRPRGAILTYDLHPAAIKYPRSRPWAWGCGRDYALGALAHGATAIEAVKIASKFDTHCGMGVDWHTL